MEHLKSIIDEIINKTCVLIIGPDLIDFGHKTFFEALCEELNSIEEYGGMVDSAPQYVFANEELFQLVSERYEASLQEMMETFYKKQIGFTIPLTQITQIPFHLIISLMPDNRLQSLFEQQAIDFNYGYYPKKGKKAPAVAKPELKAPLVYNLLGDLNHSESIITFDDLFEFLSNILGEKALPVEIEEALIRAKSFLFLGVNFEKWYAQILLRKFIPKDDRRKRYTSFNREGTNEVFAFISRRLNLKLFQTSPQMFLQDLYAECGKQGILRKKGFKKSIFLSYSSSDVELTQKIEAILQKNQIGVIRDVSSSHAGQEIDQFISTIKNLDGVILIISQHSLRSRWVCKEILTTLESHKNFYPCHVDDEFLKDIYWEESAIIIKEKLNSIGRKIGERGDASIEDLIKEREDWTILSKSLPKLKSVLTNGISKPLFAHDYENTIQQLIKIIHENG
jgi:hypothetical protein